MLEDEFPVFRSGTMSEVSRARASRRERRSCSATLAIAALALLPSCGPGDLNIFPTGPPPPQDCAALSSQSWSVGGIPVLGTELVLNVGESKQAWLQPLVESQCESVLAAVTWAVDAPSIASVQPWNGTKDNVWVTVWVTGIAPGQTAVRAHIVFSDGRVRDTQPAAVRVTPRSAPTGSTLVAEGDVALPAPPSHPGASHHFVPFRLGTSGQVDILVDWDSLLNRVDFSVYQSPCTAVESCGLIVLSAGAWNVKPLPATAPLAAGDYTIRIDNLGPGAEHVHYEVRLTPR